MLKSLTLRIFTSLIAFGMFVPLFGQARHSAPSEVDAFNSGVASLKAGDLDRAVSKLRVAVAMKPDFPPAYLNLGLAFYEKHSYNAAIIALKKASRLDPRLRGAELFLGISYYRINRDAEALPALERAVRDSSGDAEARMWLGIVYIDMNEPGKAIVPLNQAAELDPKNIDVLYHRGRAYMMLSQQSYEKMAALQPDSARVHQVVAQADAAADRDNQAIVEYKAALKSDPTNSELHDELGSLYWKTNSDANAEKELQESVTLNSSNLDALYKLGSYYVMNSEPRLARKYLISALKIDPQMAEAHYMLGRTALLDAHNSEAQEQFKLAISPNAKSTAAQLAYYQLALLYRREHRIKESAAALKDFEKLHNLATVHEQQLLEHRRKVY